MPNFDAVYKLHSACSLALVFRGNSYEPAWADNEGNLRHDAHVHTTWKLAKSLCCLYGEIASEVN